MITLRPSRNLACVNKNITCPMNAHCHRHCRKDLRITKNCIEFSWILGLLDNLPILFISFSSISLLWMLISSIDFQNPISEIIFLTLDFQKSDIRNWISEIKFRKSLLEVSITDRFKNLYRGQLFIFCLRFFSLLKNSLLEMLIAFGNEHQKNYLGHCPIHLYYKISPVNSHFHSYNPAMSELTRVSKVGMAMRVWENAPKANIRTNCFSLSCSVEGRPTDQPNQAVGQRKIQERIIGRFYKVSLLGLERSIHSWMYRWQGIFRRSPEDPRVRS